MIKLCQGTSGEDSENKNGGFSSGVVLKRHFVCREPFFIKFPFLSFLCKKIPMVSLSCKKGRKSTIEWFSCYSVIIRLNRIKMNINN